MQTQGQNIRRYNDYLIARAEAFADTKYNHTQPGALDRMKAITIEKGLLRETQIIQGQIRLLLKCDFFSHDQENEIALTAFRLLVKDLLDLYAAMNQAVMNVLSMFYKPYTGSFRNRLTNKQVGILNSPKSTPSVPLSCTRPSRNKRIRWCSF